jgi:uncharacterized protein (UPF0276 family)
LRALAEATGTDVGLENLAMALSPQDVHAQGLLLHAVLDAMEGHGYLVLDLHNLWCQLINFQIDADTLLASYPLARVRCIHLSGGRFTEPSPGGLSRRFRRDTHDGPVPEEVHALLAAVLPRCPDLEFVSLERLGHTLDGPDAASQLRRDFHRIRATVEACRG